HPRLLPGEGANDFHPDARGAARHDDGGVPEAGVHGKRPRRNLGHGNTYCGGGDGFAGGAGGLTLGGAPTGGRGAGGGRAGGGGGGPAGVMASNSTSKPRGAPPGMPGRPASP